jgi:hypothetical protein
LSQQLEEAEKIAKAKIDDELKIKGLKAVLRTLDMHVLESQNSERGITDNCNSVVNRQQR